MQSCTNKSGTSFKNSCGSSCSAIGCSLRRGTNLLSQVKMFGFPRNPIRRRAWTIALRRKNWTPNNNSKICNSHFITGRPSSDPSHPDYVPSIFSFNKSAVQKGKLANLKGIKNPDPFSSVKMRSPDNLSKIPEKAMDNYCLNKNSKKDKEDKKQFVSLLKSSTSSSNTVNLQDKLKTVQNSSFLKSKNNKKQFVSLLKSSTSSSNTVNLQDKLKTVQNSSFLNSKNVSKTYSRMNKENKNIHLVSLLNSSSTKDHFSYKILSKNLSLIKKPNNFWGISPHSNVVICARWSRDYVCEKKVVIENSLNIRAFFKDWEIDLSKLMNITCIDDLSSLLEKIEQYKIP